MTNPADKSDIEVVKACPVVKRLGCLRGICIRDAGCLVQPLPPAAGKTAGCAGPGRAIAREIAGSSWGGLESPRAILCPFREFQPEATLRDAAGIVAIRLVGLSFQRCPHMPRFNADRRQTSFGQSIKQPLRQRPGGLMPYGIHEVDPYRNAASYVNRLLRGEKPGDLPIQAPTNLNSSSISNHEGLEISSKLHFTAYEMVE